MNESCHTSEWVDSHIYVYMIHLPSVYMMRTTLDVWVSHHICTVWISAYLKYWFHMHDANYIWLLHLCNTYVLQCGAVRCSVLQCVVQCCSVLQCGVVCCNVLQCVAVCCSVLHVWEISWSSTRCRLLMITPYMNFVSRIRMSQVTCTKESSHTCVCVW